MLRALGAFVDAVDAVNRRLGRGLGYFVVATTLVCAAVVVLRYAFRISFIWMQDLYVWLHAAVFMLGASYALLRDAHVRVDIVYNRLSERTRAWIEIIGTLTCLLPWLAVLAWTAWPMVRVSWLIREGSTQPGGLPFTYVLKTVLIAFCAVTALQGLAVMGRAILVLAGRRPLVGPEQSARSAA